MQIRDILDGGVNEPVVSVPDEMPLLEAVRHLRSNAQSALLVTHGGLLAGVFSERAVVDVVAERGPAIALMTVGQAMAPLPVTCSLNDDVSDILSRMSDAGVHHIPVLRDGVPMTMLSTREFEHACHYLKAQAETDDLTGLSNRRSLLPEIERELLKHRRNRTPVTIAMLDVDLLKKVNDRLGHSAGDALLRMIARTLARECRAFDSVARIGGDEFAILFPQTRLHEAVVACKRVLGACSRLPLPRVDGVYQVSLSVGVTVSQIGDTAETFMERADRGLYQAKAEGRGRVVAIRTSANEVTAPLPRDPDGWRAAAAGRKLPAAESAPDQIEAFSASS